MKRKTGKYLRLFITSIGLSLFLWLAVSLVQPASPAVAALPPRPKPTSVSSVSGAQIKLAVTTSTTGNEWTAVQWEDPNTGVWTTVEGWQGSLEANGTLVWWVGSEQFGRGPFRWLLYAEKDGTLLDVSDNFTMPTHNKEIVTVTIPATHGE